DETLTEKIPWNQFKSYLQQEGGITDTQLKLLACKVGLSISRVFVIVDASEAYDILQCIVSDLHASHFVAYVIFSDNHFTALAAIREDVLSLKLELLTYAEKSQFVVLYKILYVI